MQFQLEAGQKDIDHIYTNPTETKKLVEIATLFEDFQLNNIKFQIKSHMYYYNMMLNGITFSVLDSRGQAHYHQFIRLIDSTSILVYNGAYLLDYSISAKSYKLVKQINNLLFLSHHQEMYTGRILVGSISNNQGYLQIQIMDFLTKQSIYLQTNKFLTNVKILQFSICYEKKNFYLIVYEQEGDIVALIKSTKDLSPSRILNLGGTVSNYHYNSDLNSYLFSRGKQIYQLRLTEQSNECGIQEKRIQVFQEEIIHCRSYDHTIVVATESIICVYYSDIKQKEIFKISSLVEEYTDDKTHVTAMEFKNNTLLVTFSNISVLWRFSIFEERSKYKTLAFSSVNLSTFNNIVIDPSGSVALLITQHSETQFSGDDLEIVNGEPSVNSVKNSKKEYYKISLLHLNILNTIYAMEPLRWQKHQCISVLTAPWRNDYLIQTKYKIIGENWCFGIDEGLCSSLHPMGLFLAVGFRDCFKVYAVISNGLTSTNAGISLRECNAISYSSSGHHLAVSSSNNIHIYDSYSYEKLHYVPSMQNFPIKQLKYKENHLIAKIKNGSCFIFHLNNNYSKSLSFYPKDFLHSSDKNVNFQYVGYDPIFDVFVVSWSQQLKFYTTGGTVELISLHIGASVTTILISRELKTMFIGTSTGQVICFPWPNNPSRLKHRHPRMKVHDQAIQQINLQNNLKQIIVLSVTGMIVVGKLKIIEKLREIKAEEIGYQNVGKIAVNNLLKQHRLIFNSVCVDSQMEYKIKELSEQVNNDIFILPLQEQKCSKIGATRLQKYRQTLNIKNNNLIQSLNNQQATLRADIRRMREKMENMKFDIIEERQFKSRDFDDKHVRILQKRFELQKKQQEIKQKNKIEFQAAKRRYDAQSDMLAINNRMSLCNLQESVQALTLNAYNHVMMSNLQEEEFQQGCQSCKQKNIQKFNEEIKFIKNNNIQLLVKNSKLQRQLNVLEMKIKDLKDPLADLEAEVMSHNPQINSQLNEKQQEIMQISNFQIRNKQFLFMKSIKNVVSINQTIDCSSYTHKSLINSINVLQQRFKEMDVKTQKIQNQVVLQKGICIRNTKLEKSLKNTLDSLKKKKKISKQKFLDSQNFYKRQIEKLAMSIANNEIGSLIVKNIAQKTKTQLCDLQMSSRATTSVDKPKRSRTQFLKMNKAFYAYQRVDNTIKNMKKIYDNHSLKAIDENQDLLEYLNSLSLQRDQLKRNMNKTLQNAQNISFDHKQLAVIKKKKSTPFQSYIRNRGQKKRIGGSLPKCINLQN